jgi:hypothetical protein
MSYTVITVEKVPKKLLEVYKNTAEPIGVNPTGVTLVPKETRGYQTVKVFILEKMSQYETRLAIAHELYHCLQYLTGCELNEDKNYQVSEQMVKALVEKRKAKKPALE